MLVSMAIENGSTEWALEIGARIHAKGEDARGATPTRPVTGRLYAEAERLRAQVAAVRALHYEHNLTRYSGECHECCDEWPCPTIRALD